jgi:ABC-type transport system involved in multi-copper enzyme maturation permease subunit
VTQTAVETRQTPTTEAQTARRSLWGSVIRSEWTKLRSVRSTVWSLFATLGITVGLGMLVSWAFVHRFDQLGPQERLTFDATTHSLRGIFLAQLAIGVLGVLVMSSEYATGLIRATLTATPQRRVVLAAKAIVFGAVALIVGMVSSFTAFFAGQAILRAKHLNVSITAPHVLRAVAGGGLYLLLIGLFGLALGAIVRRTAGAISTLFGFVLVLPLLAQALPSPWNTDVSKFLPGDAGIAMFTVRPDPDLLSAGAGLLVFVSWVLVAFIIANVLITARDA